MKGLMKKQVMGTISAIPSYLEFREVHIESAFETEGGRDGGDDLADEAVEIRVGGPLDGQVAPANVVDGFVVHHKGAVGMFQGGVGREDGIVGLHDGR